MGRLQMRRRFGFSIGLDALSARWDRASLAGLAKFARFGCVGAISGGLYAIVTVVLVSLFNLDAALASVFGYVAAVPVNFVGQRSFAFRSKSAVAPQVPRFLLTHSANIALSYGVMALATNVFNLSLYWGMIGTIVCIPIVTYFVLDRWVFSDRT